MDRSLVSKATSSDEAATPGYLYREIAKITFASVDASGQLKDFLLKKLKSSNVHVKVKALKVGDFKMVEFDLDDRSFSIWNVTSHAWKVVSGIFGIHLGSSSEDLRLNDTLTV